MSYIEKAHKALLTNQPNLAQLYMARGIKELDTRRAQHPFIMVGLGIKNYTMALNSMEGHIVDTMLQVNQFIRTMREKNRATNKG